MDCLKKKNILIVHNYYQLPGGEDTVVANEKNMLKKHGNKVFLYSRDNSELKRMGLIRKACLPFTTVFNIKTYKDIRKIIKTEKIDIVQVHNTLNLVSPSVYYAAVKCGVPVIQTIHNFRLLCPGATFYRDGHICEDCMKKGIYCAVKYRCYRDSRIQSLACVLNTFIHRMTGIYRKIFYICLTDFNKNKLLALKQINPEKVFVKPNFVAENRKPYYGSSKKSAYIFAGRLEKLKGIDILLKGWKELGEQAPKLVICGGGPLENWCKNYIAEYNLNIDMQGFIPNRQLIDLVAHSKALILPTQCYEGGFPLNIVEAFSVGTPVIVSDMGNAGSMVQDGVDGIKFKYNSITSLCDAVHRMENMNIDILGKNAYMKYREKFTEDINYTILQKIYARIQGESLVSDEVSE